MNQTYNIELCQEDIHRIINGLYLLKDNQQLAIDDSSDENNQTKLWLEWSYISELVSMLEHKFDLS